MQEAQNLPQLPKLPFLAFDGLLVLVALLVAYTSPAPLSPVIFFLVIFCIALGGTVACLPFYLEFKTHARLAEFDRSSLSGDSLERLEAIETGIQEIQVSAKRQADDTGRVTTLIEGFFRRFEEKVLQAQTDAVPLSEELRDRLNAVEAAIKALPLPATTSAIPVDLKRIEALLVYMRDKIDQLDDASSKAAAAVDDDEDPATRGAAHKSPDEAPKAPPPVPKAAPKKETPPTPAPTPAPKAVEEEEPRQPELIEGIPDSRLKAGKAGKQKTTLIAQVLIGIGNKPYIRGEGPGLSPEKGIPMEFLEIGKWQWVAPDSDSPVTCRLLKNDEIPAEGDAIVIEPGQRRSVTPHFPE